MALFHISIAPLRFVRPINRLKNEVVTFVGRIYTVRMFNVIFPYLVRVIVSILDIPKSLQRQFFSVFYLFPQHFMSRNFVKFMT